MKRGGERKIKFHLEILKAVKLKKTKKGDINE